MTEADMERRRCFEALFKELLAGIASYCLWHLRSPGDVDDEVAEVFLVAWRRLEDVPSGEAARPWLYGTAQRVIANQARSEARRSRPADDRDDCSLTTPNEPSMRVRFRPQATCPAVLGSLLRCGDIANRRRRRDE